MRFLLNKKHIRRSCVVVLAFSTSTTNCASVRQHTLITKAFLKPDLSKTIGEDAHYSLPSSVGVFDGVGGWKDSGINVSEFSNLLASSVKEYIHTNCKPEDEVDLVQALKAGMKVVKKNQVTGSSTACMVSLQSTKCDLKILNLGDSGAIIFRPILKDDTVIYETAAQCHKFNFPYQIGNIADRFLQPGSDENYADKAEDAVITTLKVQENDIILLASDGLYDNMFTPEITTIICKHLHPYLTTTLPQLLSTESSETTTKNKKILTSISDILDKTVEDLVTTALTFSLDESRMSPFVIGYIENMKDNIKKQKEFHKLTPSQQETILNRIQYRGGKPDDITVSLSLVTSIIE